MIFYYVYCTTPAVDTELSARVFKVTKGISGQLPDGTARRITICISVFEKKSGSHHAENSESFLLFLHPSIAPVPIKALCVVD